MGPRRAPRRQTTPINLQNRRTTSAREGKVHAVRWSSLDPIPRAMERMEAIEYRRTVRRFEDRELAAAGWDEIIAAAVQAPSGLKLQS